MTTTSLLSAALIAAAMHATSVMAHENAATHRYLTEGATNAAAHRVEDHAGIPAPHAGGFIAAPGSAQGDACDVGDTARLC